MAPSGPFVNVPENEIPVPWKNHFHLLLSLCSFPHSFVLTVVLTKHFKIECPPKQNQIFLQRPNLFALYNQIKKPQISGIAGDLEFFVFCFFLISSLFFEHYIPGKRFSGERSEGRAQLGFGKCGEERRIFAGQCVGGFLMRCGGHCAVQ